MLENRKIYRHSRRYLEKRKIHRRYLIVCQIRQDNPGATLQTIAEALNLTRERVRQILVSAGLPTKHLISKPNKPKPRYFCLNCNKPTFNERYCSKRCQFEYMHPLIECDYCHILFRRIQSQIIRPGKHVGYFCSKNCFGKWVSKNYGFQGGSSHARKYDYERLVTECRKLREERLSYKEISERLQMPLSSFYYILTKTNSFDGCHYGKYRGRGKHNLNKRQHQHIKVRWLKHLNFRIPK